VMFLQSSAMQDPRGRILPIFNGLLVCPSSWLRNPQPRSVNSVACGLDIAPSSKAVVLCSSPQRCGFTYDVSRFVAKGDRLPSKPFLRTGMAPRISQSRLAAISKQSTMPCCLLCGSCDKGTTKGARTNECGVCEERRPGREEERKGKEGQEKWRGALLDLGLLRRNVKRPRVGQSRGPLFWLRALFLLYLIPAIDNLLIAFSICLLVSIYMYVCLFISR
jgi:hypothetical protein